MKNFKKTAFLFLLTLAGYGTAFAQESLVVYSNTSDAPLHEVALADISKITFENETFVIHDVDKRTSPFAYSSVKSIKFANLLTDICLPQAENSDGVNLFFRDGCVGADGLTPGVACEAQICDISGRIVVADRRWNGQPISVENLAKGVYIFKVNNKAIKFTR